MSKTFRCSHCQASHDWPDYCEGKYVACPKCRQRFVAGEKPAVSAPPDVPAPFDQAPSLDVQEEDIPYAEPLPEKNVERTRPPSRQKSTATSGPGGDYAQHVHETYDRRDLQHLQPARRLVYALLVTELGTLRPDLITSIVTACLVPFELLLTLVLGFLLMLAAHAAAAFLAALGLGSFHWLLYLVPGFVILTAVVMKKSAKVEPIGLARDDRGKIDRFKLGRFDLIFRATNPATTLFMLGVLVSSQVGLLYFLPDQLGVTRDGTLVECALLTADNFLQAVLLGTLDVFNVRLAHRVEHDLWSGLVFYAFRLGYDGFVILAGFQIWRHVSMRRLFRHLPRHWRSIDFVLDWIDHSTRSEGDWAREFLDEFLFLLMVAAYLRGDDGHLRDLHDRFPWLHVDDDVRRLFVDERGERLLR